MTDKLKMLEKVNEKVSDYLLALELPGFREAHGGIDVFLNDLRDIHQKYEDKYNRIEDENK